MPDNKQPLYVRITERVPKNRWYTLNDICQMIGSNSMSYVKITLFAMPNVVCERVENPCDVTKSGKWKWRFKVVKNG